LSALTVVVILGWDFKICRQRRPRLARGPPAHPLNETRPPRRAAPGSEYRADSTRATPPAGRASGPTTRNRPPAARATRPGPRRSGKPRRRLTGGAPEGHQTAPPGSRSFGKCGAPPGPGRRGPVGASLRHREAHREEQTQQVDHWRNPGDDLAIDTAASPTRPASTNAATSTCRATRMP
jgi:hypothetical protein